MRVHIERIKMMKVGKLKRACAPISYVKESWAELYAYNTALQEEKNNNKINWFPFYCLFSRYGRVQSVKIIGCGGGGPQGGGQLSHPTEHTTTGQNSLHTNNSNQTSNNECYVSSSSTHHQQSLVSSSTTNPSSSSSSSASILLLNNNNNINKDSITDSPKNPSNDIIIISNNTESTTNTTSTSNASSNVHNVNNNTNTNSDIVCICATVSFMDIKSASKAHHAEHKLDDRILTTEYYEPSNVGVVGGTHIANVLTSTTSKHNNIINNNSSSCSSNVLNTSNALSTISSSSGLNVHGAASSTQSTGSLQYSSNVPGTSRFLSNHGLVFILRFNLLQIFIS